jgi:FKBP-type peptidyl-prolyl cis-trans isomerase
MPLQLPDRKGRAGEMSTHESSFRSSIGHPLCRDRIELRGSPLRGQTNLRRETLRHRSLIPILLMAVALVGAGCGDDDGGRASNTAPTETFTPEQPQAPPEEPRPTAKRVQPSPGEADLDRKPKVPKGKGEPPTKLAIQDLIVGKGRRARNGDRVAVQYVGVLFESGKEFDTSWRGRRPGQPFRFGLGSGQVIEGWEQGLVGMKEGGRRKLIVPSELAYGSEGFPPTIPHDAALIFDIDLEKVVR